MSQLTPSQRQQLEELLGLKFKNQELLGQALIHGSYVHEHPGSVSNDRLEFLGDAVIGLAVAQYYYENSPGASEGELTELRKTKVNEKAEADAAHKLVLQRFLQVGEGEKLKGEFNDTLLGDCYEAIVGAIHLQFDYRVASQFIQRSLISG
jgi:ribonuclease-3